MSRPIKFRVWDGCAKEMLKPFYLMEAIHYLSDVQQSILNRRPHVTFLQYTGLKDKNGVEIYEGDVLRVVAINMFVWWYHDKAQWWLDQGKNHNFTESLTGTKARQYEVIGNIYENPELLDAGHGADTPLPDTEEK